MPHRSVHSRRAKPGLTAPSTHIVTAAPAGAPLPNRIALPTLPIIALPEGCFAILAPRLVAGRPPAA